ncbi:MAG: homoserine kinase [Cyanobacteria bacterium J003]|nr:MAG: homoserine kinase [Cyanobacteria bacterium J003]
MMTVVTVPATTANLGPGFDCLGAALTLTNTFTFSLSDRPHVSVRGTEAASVSSSPNNLAYRAYSRFYEHLGREAPPVYLEIDLGVPLARGLGSSATAIIGGLVGANRLAGFPLNHTEVLELAIEMEGHPDNVVPALLGGCRLAVQEGAGGWHWLEIPWDQDVVPIVAIPDFELATETARQVLPCHCTYGDAVFNISHLGALLRGLETGQREWLQLALADRLHQPYRQSLIKGYTDLHRAALEAGAHGLVISGAGPTLLALGDPVTASAIATALKETWATFDVQARVEILAIQHQGTTVGDR